MKENILIEKSKTFALAIMNICEKIKNKNILVNQLLRSGTSIGANIHEANYAHGKSDFIAKLQIALKECFETEYWLDLFIKTNIITHEDSSIINQCGEIKALLISSINTAKQSN